MKWEKWGTMDYTQLNIVAPPAERQNSLGVPLQYATEAPKLIKTWIKKNGNVQDYFEDFTSPSG